MALWLHGLGQHTAITSLCLPQYKNKIFITEHKGIFKFSGQRELETLTPILNYLLYNVNVYWYVLNNSEPSTFPSLPTPPPLPEIFNSGLLNS